ncbi:MAG: thiamine diphosphokinase [Thermoleophilia bacterium]|nr:thiamine diphosphokinase [Thermoleophilia bacterium]
MTPGGGSAGSGRPAAGDPTSGPAGPGRGRCGADAGDLVALVLLDGDYEDAGYYRRRCAEAGFLVAADGGLRFALAHGVRVDLLIGDFDSLGAADVAAAERAGVRVERHPVRKDATDGELAVEAALAEGAGELVLAGALGGALDHVVGHLALLRRATRRGAAARIVAPRLCVTALAAPAEVGLDAAPGARVSLAPLEGDARVTLEGLVYPLRAGVLAADACLGLGNAVSGDARITVHDGVVAVFVHDGEETFGRRRREPR